MKIVLAGATGFLGRELRRCLQEEGHEVLQLVRRPAERATELTWNPALGQLDAARLEGADAIVNLAGENIAGGRWTEARREALLRSRVDATRTLVVALKQVKRRPAVFINASASGYYGERGDEELTESSPMGHGFLPEICLAWETHAEGAARLGVRTVVLRLGVVLGRDGGALAKMLPVFRLGLGGRLGRGDQWMSWISLADAVGVVQHVIAHPACSGAVNAVAPTPVRNADFSAALARVLRRPLLLPVPRWVLRLAFGRMALETVLVSTRVLPAKLRAGGYVYRHPQLEDALRWALG